MLYFTGLNNEHFWCNEDVGVDSYDMIFEVNYFLDVLWLLKSWSGNFQDFQERRCFGSWDARFVSWSEMTVFWLGCQPAAFGNRSCRANKDIMGLRLVNQDRSLCPDRWMSRGTRPRVLVTGNKENQKEAINKKYYFIESCFENKRRAGVRVIFTWHLLRLHRCVNAAFRFLPHPPKPCPISVLAKNGIGR
jgi:hypothetical protein